MTLTFLGAGGAFSRRFGTTCSLLEIGDQERWLIDCGRQAPEQLAQAGLSWHEIQGQLITHVHGDHVYGLEEFAFARYFSDHPAQPAILRGGLRPAMMVHSAVRKELWEFLFPSLRYLGTREQAKEGSLDDYFEVVAASERGGVHAEGWALFEHFSHSGLELRARITEHVPRKPSCGFEIRGRDWPGDFERGPLVWWSGDSRAEPSFLEDMARRATVIFHDCSFLPQGALVHGDFEVLATLSPATRKKIVLMHHDDDLAENQERARSLGFRIALPNDIYDLRSGLCLRSLHAA